MSEIARERIEVNRRTKDPLLDLGRSGITSLAKLPELFECVWL